MADGAGVAGVPAVVERPRRRRDRRGHPRARDPRRTPPRSSRAASVTARRRVSSRSTSCTLVVVADGRIEHAEQFDAAAVEAMLARLDELAPPAAAGA